MQQAGERPPRAVVLGIGAIAVAYLIQIATPIRLDTDSVRYLAMAVNLADRTGSVPDGFPAGYPLILAGLDRMGLGSAHSIVAWNCLFIGIAMWVIWWMTSSRPIAVRLWTILLTLLSVHLIRTVAMPHPEATFLAISLAAIAAMSRMTDTFSIRNLNLLIAAVVLMGIALSIRIAAVALIPPLLWCVLQVVRGYAGTGRKQRLVAFTATAMFLLFAVFALAISEHGTLSRYFAEGLSEVMSKSPVMFIYKRIQFTVRGAGEVFTNIPLRQVFLMKPIVQAIGVVVIILFIIQFKRMQFGGAVRVYLLTYLLMLFAWPYYDPRLWMPILPLLVLWVVSSVHALPKGAGRRLMVAGALPVYIAFGLAALAYTTRISWSGERFRSVYGFNGGLAKVGHSDPEHDSYARMIIRRYDSKSSAWRTFLNEPAGKPEGETR